MPLPPTSVERKLLHTRTIVVEGHERADGLFDIDAWLTDVKTYGFPNRDRGELKPGEPLHGMGLRLTVDLDMTIHDCVAVTDFSPFRICSNITPSFKKLVGVKIRPGFTRVVKELLGGVQGCTHLVELMGPVATTAFQTMSTRFFEKMKQEKPEDRQRPRLMNSCHAWAEDGPIVEREYPKFFTGPRKSDAPAS